LPPPAARRPWNDLPVLLALWSAAYWAAIVLTCPLFFAGLLVVWALTAGFDRRRVLVHLYSCFWATFFVFVNPRWTLAVTGRDRIPWSGGAVLVANHSSLIDILVLFGLYRPYKWVSKRENFKIPFIGWGMTLNGYVPLVRGDRVSVVAMFEHCARLIRAGSAVMLFPEGTRSRDARLQAFKDGAFELAVEHRVPLIPIAVHGTGRALAKGSLVLREHVHAKVEVLEPLDPAGYPSVAALRDEAHRRIAAALG
jgi:1-acyl-sn-glycerol-3-phosphate acyltransferase